VPITVRFTSDLSEIEREALLAGLKQHSLPQFLMKGFYSRISDTDLYTWVCRKDGKIFESNLKNIGKETSFYGTDGPNSLDESITNYENEIAPKIDQLRQRTSSFEINDPSIAGFVAHIGMRTRHLRESMADSLEELSLAFMKHIEIPSNLLPMIKKMIIYDPPPQVKTLKRQLMRRGYSNKQCKKYFLEYFENNIEQSDPLLRDMRQHIEKKIRSLAGNSQLKALLKDVIPLEMAVNFNELHWHLLYSDHSHYILGDLGVLMRFQPGAEYLLFPENSRSLEAVFFPISSNHLLVGTVAEGEPAVNPEEINAASAQNSKEFFISSQRTLVDSYRSEIGTHNPLITDEEQRLLLEKVIQELP
jgi:hypothetical protein